MNHRLRILPAFLAATIAITVTAAPAFGGYSIVPGPVEEIVERQSLSIEAGLLGNHALLDDGQQSIVAHPFFGFYGEDGITTGVAASWHTSRLLPWHAGVSAAVMDMSLQTWSLGVSGHRQVWESEVFTAHLQWGLAYQRMFGATSNPTGITLGSIDPTNPYGDDVLFDSFTLGHAMALVAFAADLKLIRVVFDTGWVGTMYRFDAHECPPDVFCTEGRGPARDGSGEVSKTTWGLGASLGVEPLFIYGGFRVGGDAGTFQTSVGWVF